MAAEGHHHRNLTGSSAIGTRPADESLWRLRWRLRMAIVRGRLDMHDPGRESVRAAIERHFPDQNSSKIERRFLEVRRRQSLIRSSLKEGKPHAARAVRIEGLGHLETALSGGVGAILASAHFGSGQLIKPVLGAHGWPALLVGGPVSAQFPPSAARDLPAALNLRPHLAALRANKPLIIMVDGRRARSLIEIQVLGVGVRFAPGAVRIARAAGAPVLPTFVLDEGTFRDPLAIRLVIHPPLVLQSSADVADDTIENLGRFAAVFADELERNPHNLDWSAVSESGEYRSPRDPRLRKAIAGSSARPWPAHDRRP